MIIVRSPLRISIGGGGTDLPAYYRENGGFLIAGAIDKYVYITLNETFSSEYLLRYSSLEMVSDPLTIRHPIIREVLNYYSHTSPPLEITSSADIPAGTGLGSSGSFTTALIKAIATYKRIVVSQHDLAEQACHVEMNLINEPVGKQDQFIAAYGGLTCFDIKPDGTVSAKPLDISEETLHILEDNLILYFTGYSRKSSSILAEQDTKIKKDDRSVVESLHFIKELGYKIQKALESSDPDEFGRLMHEHWLYKKRMSNEMTNSHIDEIYEMARKRGALGGKLIGAGGGGFLLLYSLDSRALRKELASAGLKEARFRFVFEGTKILS